MDFRNLVKKNTQLLELVFMPVPVRCLQCSRNRISVSSGKGLDLISNDVSLLAQLVERCTGMTEVMGSNPVGLCFNQALFQLLIRKCSQLQAQYTYMILLYLQRCKPVFEIRWKLQVVGYKTKKFPRCRRSKRVHFRHTATSFGK